MITSVYDFRDYKVFICEALKTRKNHGRGERSRLATAIRCHTAYVSQVLKGNSHLSLGQGMRAAKFLGLDSSETHYFILLLQISRAETPELRHYFTEQVSKVHEERTQLRNRLTYEKTLKFDDQATYYSSWLYSAVHILLSIPHFRSREVIANYFDIPIQKISDILDFLVSAGLAIEQRGSFIIGTNSVHLGDKSPFVSQHHANWRNQAISSMDREAAGDLHYSSVVTLSELDVPKVRSVLIQAIEEVRKIVKPSKEERLYCYLLDLFPVPPTRGKTD